MNRDWYSAPSKNSMHAHPELLDLVLTRHMGDSNILVAHVWPSFI